MLRSSHSQLCKRSSCSVKLQDGLFDHNPTRILAQNFTFNLISTFLFSKLYKKLIPGQTLIVSFFASSTARIPLSNFDICQYLRSIYFPGDESNTGSTDNVTCIDINSSDVSDGCYEISDGINMQESCEVTSPEMMIKQAFLKELLYQR